MKGLKSLKFAIALVGIATSGIVELNARENESENSIYAINRAADRTGTEVLSEPMEAGKNATLFRGRVVDSNNEVLPGASIQVFPMKDDKSAEGTICDLNGFYRFTHLKPGKYLVKVSYIGYNQLEEEIELSLGGTCVKDFVMSGTESLNEVLIVSALSGERKAINVQKNNMGISNVVSQDQIGKFPDSNIGDALKRINGISVQYDQGEARFGQIRGTSPDMSSVTINGNRLPSAESDVRNVQLDLIPSDMVQTIEVNKVVTSDMDGDAIGGAINLVTKNTPYRRLFNLTAGTGYNWVSNKMQLNLGATWGERFFNNKLGVMAAVSYQNAPAGSDNTEFTYLVKDDKVVLDDMQIRQYYVTRERQSYSLSLDYDINAKNKIYFKGIYNRRNDWENRYRITYKAISEGEKKMSARIQTKGGSSDNKNARLERQQTMDFTLGGEHTAGRLGISWNGSYARASEHRPDERYFDLQLKKQTFEIIDAFERQPYTTTVVDPTEGGKWGIKEITNSHQRIVESEYKARVDFTLPIMEGRYGNTLKFGGKFTRKNKSRETMWYDYTDWYESEYGDEYTKHYTLQVRDGFMPGSQYQKANFVSKEYLGSLSFNPANGERVLEESSTDYNAHESITAAYLRWDQKLGKGMKLTAGLRMEATHLSYGGLIWDVNEDTEDESLTPTEPSGNNYVSLLPSLLWKWDISDNWKVRASFTKTIARPKYSYLIPSVGIDTKSGSRTEIKIGNPDLKPAESYNLDLQVERYFSSIGMVSAGLFYKKINNFVVEEVTYGPYKNFDDCEITKPVNGFDGSLLGVELAFQRDFGFITPALKCVGIYANYTYTYNKVSKSYIGSEDEKVLPGSPKNMLNASIYLELGGFNARLSYNHTSSFQDDEEYQSDARLRRYYDATHYLDLNASYTFGKRYKATIYAEANNLLNQPLRYFIGGNKNTTTQVEYYNVKFNCGIKLNL